MYYVKERKGVGIDEEEEIEEKRCIGRGIIKKNQ